MLIPKWGGLYRPPHPLYSAILMDSLTLLACFLVIQAGSGYAAATVLISCKRHGLPWVRATRAEITARSIVSACAATVVWAVLAIPSAHFKAFAAAAARTVRIACIVSIIAAITITVAAVAITVVVGIIVAATVAVIIAATAITVIISIVSIISSAVTGAMAVTGTVVVISIITAIITATSTRVTSTN